MHEWKLSKLWLCYKSNKTSFVILKNKYFSKFHLIIIISSETCKIFTKRSSKIHLIKEKFCTTCYNNTQWIKMCYFESKSSLRNLHMKRIVQLISWVILECDKNLWFYVLQIYPNFLESMFIFLGVKYIIYKDVTCVLIFSLTGSQIYIYFLLVIDMLYGMVLIFYL